MISHSFVGGVCAFALLVVGCSGGWKVGSAALNTAIGVGVSAKRRSAGQCFVPCAEGTRCNPKTGYCDALPCRGKCKASEWCRGRGLQERCVPHLDSLPSEGRDDLELEPRGK